MTGIFISTSGATVGETIEAMNTITREWTDQAARGECGWICSDCCISFPEGMPDECPHGHQKCTDIIKRDKADAMTPNAKVSGAGTASAGLPGWQANGETE